MTNPQFWWFLARSTGLVAWALLALTVTWGLLLRTRLLADWTPWAWTSSVHRFLGVLAVLFTGMHLTGLLLDTYIGFGLRDILVPLASSWRPVPVALGVLAGYLLLAVLATSLIASRLPRRWWHRVHLTSYLLFWLATMHFIAAGTDATHAAVRTAVAAAVTLVLLLTLARVRATERPARLIPSSLEPASGTPHLGAGSSSFHPLTVAEVRRETPDAVSVRFALPSDLTSAFRYRPGQHVLLRARIAGTPVSRPYSICSDVTDGELRIAVRQLPGGCLSTWVNTVLRAGDVVDVAEPAGAFATDVNGLAARHVLGVAAGSGITPVISILSSVLAVEPASRCTLIYGNRTAASTLFAARLAELQARYPARLHVVHVRSQEPAHPPTLPGRIDRSALDLLAVRGDLAGVDEAYVCGPAAMTTEVRTALVDDLGLLPARVHTEVFSAVRPAPPTGVAAGDGSVRVRHRGVEHTVPVAAGESILDAGLRSGLDLPYLCRAGACGSCRATISSGPTSEVASTCQIGYAAATTVDFDAVAAPAPATPTLR
jgi:ferredoxin-NADP reductase/DMSO/TMAO reductase YedYZ heme-binding membrane subunit